MRLASFLGAIALAIGAHAAAAEDNAPADRWVYAYKADSGDVAYFDALTVKRESGIVTYWSRVVFKTPQPLSKGESYVEAVSESSTECGASWSVMKTLILANERGEAIRRNELQGDRAPIDPDSLGSGIQAAVCKFVNRTAALKPKVMDSISDAPQWTPLTGVDPGLTGEVSRASIQRKGALTGAIVRFSYAEPSMSPGDVPFRNMYVRFDIDCARSRLWERGSDYTDDNGRLVDVQPVPAPNFTEIPASGAGASHLKQLVCGDVAGATKTQAAANSAPADDTWTLVTRSPDKREYAVDITTIRPRGKYVESWQRERPVKPIKTKSGLVYDFVFVHSLDDCEAGTSAGLNVRYMRATGDVVRSLDYPEDKLNFEPQAPQTIGGLLQDYVCSYARRIAGLKPNFSPEALSKADWASLDTPVNAPKIAIDRSTIQRDGGTAIYLTRAEARAGSRSENGMPYRTIYLAWQADCEKEAARGLAADYYDDKGKLVDVSTVGDYSTVPFTPLTPSSSLAEAERIACSDDGASSRATTDEPQLASGTAWLGPKGYLITASHVVKGATAIAIVQDGDPIGEAEVVVDDPNNDVAILKPTFKTPSLHPVIGLAPTPAKLGEHVFTLGYPAPDVLGTSVKLTSGDISGLNGSDLIHGRTDDARLLQISVPIQHGNSGGPILDSRGEALGVVVTRFQVDGEAALQNVSYAMKIAYVRRLLADLPDIGGYRVLKPSASVSGLASDLRNSIFMLLVASGKEK